MEKKKINCVRIYPQDKILLIEELGSVQKGVDYLIHTLKIDRIKQQKSKYRNINI